MKLIAKPKSCVRVYQHNVLGYYSEAQRKQNRHGERMLLLIETIRLIKPDIAIFEEVMPDNNFLGTLLEALGPEYHAICTYTNGHQEHQVVIITHYERATTECVDLRADDHNGLNLALLIDGEVVGVGALHSTWAPIKEAHRMVQGSYLRRSLKSYRHAIIAGDCNMIPLGPSVQDYFRAGYKSAHKEVHNREAASFPTLFGKKLYSKRFQLLQQFVSTISGNRGGGNYCLDYVFVRGFVVRNCQLVTTKDPEFDISDHSGVVADLCLDNPNSPI